MNVESSKTLAENIVNESAFRGDRILWKIKTGGDNDGKVSINELSHLLKRSGVELNKEQRDTVKANIGDGVEEKTMANAMKQALEALDKNHDGKLDKAEMKQYDSLMATAITNAVKESGNHRSK
jgi:Ca2+-binding EF-hand superfamily protein